MEQSKWIQELTELDKELEKIPWGNEVRSQTVRFAHIMRYYCNGCGGGEIDGLLTIFQLGSVILRLDELIGFNLHWLFDYYDDGDKLDEEDSCRKEKAELQLKYCQMIESFNMEYWTPEIKKLFEDGLDFLFNRMEQATPKQGVSK